jgi:hypothetical protein
MNATSIPKTPLVIALLLAAVMAVARFHHFGSTISLPDASLAVFFLAGFYLRSPLLFAGFLAEAALIDYVAITYGGVSGWCISPAYVFLIPTYASVWFAGRWVAAHYRHAWRTLTLLFAALAVGVTVAFLISNGSFYLLSGRFPQMSVAEYSARVAKYFLPYAMSTFVYVMIATAVHAVAMLILPSEPVNGKQGL